MSLEIRMLAWSIVLGIVQLLLASAWASSERGLKWNAGPRDGTSAPLGPVAGRAERASHNFLETFPFFAAAVLAVVATGRTGALSALGVQLYFWARLVYVPLYLGGACRGCAVWSGPCRWPGWRWCCGPCWGRERASLIRIKARPGGSVQHRRLVMSCRCAQCRWMPR